MFTLIGIATLALMVLLAVKANARFAAYDQLPMQFGLDGQPTWRASRALALSVMPGLAVLVFVPLALLAPDTLGGLIGALSLLGGQVFYHHMIARHL